MNFTNPLHQIIHDNVVQPALEQRRHGTIGTVIKYNHEHNVADVDVPIPDIYGQMGRYNNVPVSIQGGLKASGLFPDDHVYIEYSGGSETLPKIVGVADETYKYKTRERHKHQKSGSMVPDMFCGRS